MHNFEVVHDFPNIGKRIMLLNASRIIQKEHREQLILLIIEDVTEVRMKTEELQRKEREMYNRQIEQQKRQSELLEEAVKQRTGALMDANAELEKKNNELNAFNFVASHDLQEPLRKIQTLTARIIEKENQNLSETGKDYFRRMENAAKRMQVLIHDLLTFSRLNTGERKFEKVNLGIIIEDVKKDFKELIVEKKATIEIKEICEVNIIPFQFHQLMQNLIGNALKFSNPKIPPHIIIESHNILGNKINIENLSPEKEYCHISISDNGIGFEKEFNEKIFEVFQKLHGKEEYEGTGIGLAIVKKIVENHNGFITATGEFGKGATFDIYIPA
jgi:two-component system CheB/CheR fusion protein